MTRHLEDPFGRILELHRKAKRRSIIALAGYPGSGKTTLARMWENRAKESLGPGSFLALGMDGFHLTRDQLSRMSNPDEAFARRGAPWTFDPEGFIRKLRELKESYGAGTVGWPGFEHHIGDPVDEATLVPPECRLLLIEGIYVLLRSDEWSGLEGLFDETWFLDTSLETSMERLYTRHREAWGISEEEARARADGNDRLNCEYIAPGRELADFLIGGETH